MSHLVELRPNKNLIDSNFEGYKLSLDQIPGTNHELPNGVKKLDKIGDTFSYLYLVPLGMHNHLTSDPWNEYNLYYVSENRKIIKIELQTLPNDINECNIQELVEIGGFDESKEHCYNATITFVSPSMAVVSTGTGVIHVINTGLRSCSQNWTVESSLEILDHPFTVLDARVREENNEPELHCLISSIVEKKDAKQVLDVSRAFTELHWVVIKKKGDNWTIDDVFKFHSLGAVRCAYFTPACQHLFIESNKPIELGKTEDKKKNQQDAEANSDQKDPEYYWQQSSDDIKIWFGLPRECVKDDIKVDIDDKRISVKIKNLVRLEGNTFQRLDSELTTWNISDHRLEIIICKHEEAQMWRYLVENDVRGQELVDDELVKQVHERLAHLCSETEEIVDDTTPTFNPGQLEACDNAPDEDFRLIVIDGKTKTLTKEASLIGHQKIFNIRLNESTMGICVRHDVDGIIWKLVYDDNNFCEHIGSLNAFGYIIASKQWKYSTCSPDLSYAVIATIKQNLFLYKQNCSVSSDLRNRKTGQKFPRVGKQYLISLSTSDEILGVHATNDYLFVLTKQLISVYCMKSMK